MHRSLKIEKRTISNRIFMNASSKTIITILPFVNSLTWFGTNGLTNLLKIWFLFIFVFGFSLTTFHQSKAFKNFAQIEGVRWFWSGTAILHSSITWLVLKTVICKMLISYIIFSKSCIAFEKSATDINKTLKYYEYKYVCNAKNQSILWLLTAK